MSIGICQNLDKFLSQFQSIPGAYGKVRVLQVVGVGSVLVVGIFPAVPQTYYLDAQFPGNVEQGLPGVRKSSGGFLR